MRPNEMERQAVVQAGKAAVANLKEDKDLVAWAEQAGLALYIGRGSWGRKASIWKNPYAEGKHGNRDEVCNRFAEYLESRPDLLAQIPSLRGKLLVCWCKPLRCHGDRLAELANGAD